MNRNSALIWLPKIEAAGLPTPKTIVVNYDHHAFVALLEREAGRCDPVPTWEAIGDACESIGYPCFVRTDLGSAKHCGPKSYLVTDAYSIPRVFMGLVEDQELKFWLEKEGPLSVLVRQFLDLDASFTAFNGLPIAREWRFFADGKKVQCYHPYWPEDVLEGRVEGGTALWREQLANHHTIPDCFDNLCDIAIAAASCVGGDWSVDFAMDKNNKWWLIDMAVKADSWHFPGCCA